MPSTVVIDDSSYLLRDGTAAFNLTYPGSYQVELVAFAILDAGL